MEKFKVGDIVKSNEDIIFKIDTICYCGLEVFGKKLSNNEQIHYSSDEVKKVTFYEMLDFIKVNDYILLINLSKCEKSYTNCGVLTINKLLSNIDENRILGFCDEIEEGIDKTYYKCYYIQGKRYCDKSGYVVDFDNLDFDFDLREIEVKEKMNELLNIAENNLKDAFKKSMVYGEETTVGDFLSKCCNSYIDLINNDNKKVEINMTRKEKELKDKIDTVDYWYTAVKEMLKLEPKKDEVFVNNKKKTVVIKWADGRMTKVTCDKEDKYDLEKGVLYAMLKKFYAVEYINSMIDKAKKSQELDMQKWRNKENKKVKETLNKKKTKKVKSTLDDDLPF